MYRRIRENNGNTPLRIVELKTITKKEIEEFKKHVNPLKKGYGCCGIGGEKMRITNKALENALEQLNNISKRNTESKKLMEVG